MPCVAQGEAIAAFALSEPEAGSDVAAMQCSARQEGQEFILEGEKTWISNGGIADFYVVFAKTDPAAGTRGISAFIVDADAPGLEIAERIDVIAPHPLARLRFSQCRIPASHLLGAPGQGFKLAMRTLDIFRTSVGAAALGFARHAFAAACQRATSRKMFGQSLGDFQITQQKLAQMATAIDAAALHGGCSGRVLARRPPGHPWPHLIQGTSVRNYFLEIQPYPPISLAGRGIFGTKAGWTSWMDQE